MSDEEKTGMTDEDRATIVFARPLDLLTLRKISEQVDTISLVVVALAGVLYILARKVLEIEVRLDELAK